MFYGREAELTALNELDALPRFQLVVVLGRKDLLI